MSAILETKASPSASAGLVAVNDFDLQVEEGEILGLIGPNGAGKSTVFALVSGFLPVTSGHVIFDGKDITNHAPFRIARAGIARAFQQSLTFQGMTVLDNVLVGFHKIHQARLASSVVRSGRARAEERELEEKGDDHPGVPGDRRVAGREAGKPASRTPEGSGRRYRPGLGAQSPAARRTRDGMNPSESDMMISHIRQVRERGVTVVVVEHDMRVVRSVCDRLVCMNFGQKLCEGDPDYVTSHPEVCEAYLGKGAFSAA